MIFQKYNKVDGGILHQ